LSDILLSPVRPYLKKGDRVIVVPDGALSAVNFETLPVFEGTPHYWLEDATVAVAPALYTLDSPPPVAKGRRSLLLIGDPEAYEPKYPRLRHAAEEIADIRKAFSFADTSVYTGSLASPVAYENALPGEFSMIHFAAHAEANPESPLDSAVILSRSTEGFKLYARDILKSPLRTDLVTISACRSAGDKAYSGEGLVGFAWAFLHAGSRSVIAGLWDVADRSTAQLMTVLYRELAGGAAPIDALRTAKLSLLKAGGVVQKPYYWGPFQLYIRCLPR
jgi:CHAT domain-containing protein